MAHSVAIDGEATDLDSTASLPECEETPTLTPSAAPPDAAPDGGCAAARARCPPRAQPSDLDHGRTAGRPDRAVGRRQDALHQWHRRRIFRHGANLGSDAIRRA